MSWPTSVTWRTLGYLAHFLGCFSVLAYFNYLGCLSVLAYFLGQISQDIEAVQDTQVSQVPQASQIGEVGQDTQATQDTQVRQVTQCTIRKTRYTIRIHISVHYRNHMICRCCWPKGSRSAMLRKGASNRTLTRTLWCQLKKIVKRSS